MEPVESLGAVDNSRRWNFSICLTNKGVMAILVKGCNSKNEKKHTLLGWSNWDAIFGLFCLNPSTKMTISPLFALGGLLLFNEIIENKEVCA